MNKKSKIRQKKKQVFTYEDGTIPYEFDPRDLDGDIDRAIERLQSWKAAVIKRHPEAEHETITLDYVHPYCDTWTFNILFDRMETLEEMRERVKLAEEAEEKHKTFLRTQLSRIQQELGDES